MANPTKAELLEKAKELGLDVNEDMTNKELAEEIKAAEAPAPKQDESNPGDSIADAIAKGLAGVAQAEKDRTQVVITTDPNVQTRFSVVRNKQGEVLIRENETGTLSRLQLQSIEEKQAALQDQEVEVI